MFPKQTLNTQVNGRQPKQWCRIRAAKTHEVRGACSSVRPSIDRWGIQVSHKLMREALCRHMKNPEGGRSYHWAPTKQILRKGGKDGGRRDPSDQPWDSTARLFSPSLPWLPREKPSPRAWHPRWESPWTADLITATLPTREHLSPLHGRLASSNSRTALQIPTSWNLQ